MKQRKNKNRKQNFDNYIITTTEYEQEYPIDIFPIKKQNDRIIVFIATLFKKLSTF